MYNYPYGSTMHSVDQINRNLYQHSERMRRSSEDMLRLIAERNRPLTYDTAPLPPLPQAKHAVQPERRSLLMRLLRRKG